MSYMMNIDHIVRMIGRAWACEPHWLGQATRLFKQIENEIHPYPPEQGAGDLPLAVEIGGVRVAKLQS
jgi:hypothetical protein